MRRWQRWIAAIVAILLVGTAVLRWHDLRQAASEVADIPVPWTVALGALYVVAAAAQGMLAMSTAPALTWRQGVQVQQATTAANNTIIGSGIVSTGTRVAMMRTWGVSDRSIVLSIVARNVLAAYGLWLVAGIAGVIGIVSNASEVIDRRLSVVLVVVSLLILTASTLLWHNLLRSTALSAWLARRTQHVWDAIRRRFVRLPDVCVEDMVNDWRQATTDLMYGGARQIVGAALVNQLVMIAIPLAIVRAVGCQAVTDVEAFITYALVRLAAAVSPIPGGLLVTDIGMAVLLFRFGATNQQALAAVVVYRLLTLVLPIFTGGACFAWWRRQARSARQSLRVDRPPRGVLRSLVELTQEDA